ncbi:MAG: DUF350 domain-containing protein [Planctomycetota bacterium]
MNWELFFQHLFEAAVFVVLGIALFTIAIKYLQKALPFSITKEIAEDHNTALAIVMGCGLLGIAIIIAAAIHG